MAERLGAAASKITGKMTPASVLQSLMRSCAAIKVKVTTHTGELGEKLKNAEETHGIHRGAFKLAMKLEKMEDLKRKDFLTSLDYYREVFDLDPKADLVDEMSKGGDNVVHLGEKPAGDQGGGGSDSGDEGGCEQTGGGDEGGDTNQGEAGEQQAAATGRAGNAGKRKPKATKAPTIAEAEAAELAAETKRQAEAGGPKPDLASDEEWDAAMSAANEKRLEGGINTHH